MVFLYRELPGPVGAGGAEGPVAESVGSEALSRG